MRIYLTGFMGSGKTSVGKKIANQLGYNFVDLDDFIEERHKISIPGIFEKFDETAFRILENKTLIQTFKFEKTVISTGGGTPCFHDNMKLMNQNGVTAYIKMHPKSLYHRLINSKKKRPLIMGKTEPELMAYIDQELTYREPYYHKANIILKGESLNLTSFYDDIHKIIEQKKNELLINK